MPIFYLSKVYSNFAFSTGHFPSDYLILDPFQQAFFCFVKLCFNISFLTIICWPLLLAYKILFSMAFLTLICDLCVMPILSLDSWFWKSWPSVHMLDSYLLNITEMIGDNSLLWIILFWWLLYYFSPFQVKANMEIGLVEDEFQSTSSLVLENYKIITYKVILLMLAVVDLLGKSLITLRNTPYMWE